MSAAQVRAETLEIYQGTEAFVYPDEEYVTLPAEGNINKALDSSVFAPEICGLAITGLLALLAIIVSFALNYAILSLIFVVPFVGVLLGFGYIGYLKKYGKY